MNNFISELKVHHACMHAIFHACMSMHNYACMNLINLIPMQYMHARYFVYSYSQHACICPSMHASTSLTAPMHMELARVYIHLLMHAQLLQLYFHLLPLSIYIGMPSQTRAPLTRRNICILNCNCMAGIDVVTGNTGSTACILII